MAIAHVGLGLVLAHARSHLEHRLHRLDSPRRHALTHALPSVMATLVLLAGVALIARSALSA